MDSEPESAALSLLSVLVLGEFKRKSGQCRTIRVCLDDADKLYRLAKPGNF